MANQKTTKLYRTAVRGLFTESNPLTSPEDFSFDEDNCQLFTSGTRTRRFGIDVEDDHVLSSANIETPFNKAINEFVWKNAANVDGLDFLCVHVDSVVYFWNISGVPTSGDYSGSALLEPFSSNFGYLTQSVQFARGEGYLFVIGPSTDPVRIEYNQATNTFTVERINILIRDFDGVQDNLGIDEEPSTLSPEHHYNLMNQGWDDVAAGSYGSFEVFSYNPFGEGLVSSGAPVSSGVISQYYSKVGRYPSNAKQWFLGKVEVEGDGFKAGDFNPTLLNKFHMGNSQAPRGHFVISPFNKDRTGVSGITGVSSEVTNERPSSVCFAAGHVFYGFKTTVFFSQVLTDKHKAGLCFQANDPTSENVPDLLPTDGGVIEIPAADKIVALKEIANGVMVFCTNGVWFINSVDKGFSADDYSITKVSSIGTQAPYSIVEDASSLYYWSETGIQKVSQQSGAFGTVPGAFEAVNLTESSIDTYIKDVPTTSVPNIKSVYDPATKTISWLFQSLDSQLYGKFDRILNYNTILEAFHPWSVAPSGFPESLEGFTPARAFPWIAGVFLTPKINRIQSTETITSDGDIVVNLGAEVTTTATDLTSKDTFIKYIIGVPQTAFGVYGSRVKLTFGNFDSNKFADWYKTNNFGRTYNTFFETGFELLSDAIRNKQIIYVQFYFNRTESVFISDGMGGYTGSLPSSCIFTTKWQWSDTTASNKWTAPIEIYRHLRVPPVGGDLLFDTGHSVVTTRHKVRGMGKSLQMRFSCEERGKTFEFLGYQIQYQGNTEP